MEINFIKISIKEEILDLGETTGIKEEPLEDDYQERGGSSGVVANIKEEHLGDINNERGGSSGVSVDIKEEPLGDVNQELKQHNIPHHHTYNLRARVFQYPCNGIHKGQYSCILCKTHFTKKFILKRHMLRAHGNIKTFCSICKKEFKYLKQHIAAVHSSNKKMFTCPECAATFTQKSKMQAHLECVHFGIKRYCCDVCGHTFYCRGDLVVHMRRHNWVKPFQCTMCKKKFVSSGDLARLHGAAGITEP